MISSEQENEIVEKILKSTSLKNSVMHLKSEITELLPPAYNGKSGEAYRIIEQMQEYSLINVYSKDEFSFTTLAREIKENGGWFKYLSKAKDDDNLEQQIKYLTYEHFHKSIQDLEMSIQQRKISLFQVKYWWFIVLLSAVAGAAASKLLNML